ncbi:putative beta-glucosidase I [Pseudocercospora fuligena]|uniref:beta-glucosidase n=1 Tax=Pseudocercospora fuligena TaxID=685502 RepID=A0A8H6RPC2_9PEZI|nr:putative beta-glucosidase I [Pseudocercospora fuligena]
MASKYKDFDVQETLEQLTIGEKISLVSGTDFWHLAGVPRLGIPAIRTSDGPNGVRGTKFFNGVPAACLPCGTALGATWDVDLLRKGGELMGREAIAKGASVLLGPTVNMQRSPLGGRGFESYSEDPVLAGNLAAASVSGIQSTGVSATLKHFVCNDLEDKRMSSNSILSERALREVYLLPFQIAQRDAQPWSYMTSYNLVNGLHASENPKLLQKILREEWGFDGLVMSDWFGVYSTTESIKAGLDLEMPGPPSLRGQQVDLAMRCGKLLRHHLDARVTEVLKLIKKLIPLQIEENAEERTIDSPETASLLRSIAAQSLVLTKNEGSILPFKKEKTTAVIGPNAAVAAYCGGGSASLLPYYTVSPLDGIKAKAKDVQYELGAPGWKRLPLLSRVAKTSDGRNGLIMKIFLEPPSKSGRQAIDELLIKDTNAFLFDYKNPQLNSHLFYADIDGTFTPEETAEYEFSCSVAGTAKVFVDGKEVVDNLTKQRPGDSFFGVGTREEIGGIQLEAGKTYNVHIEFGSMPTLTYKKEGVTAFGAGGIRLGLHRKVDMKVELERAVSLAKKVDQVVVVAGLNSDWESEGYDREHMDLPPGNDELIAAVIAANPNTAVVVHSGTPVTMPWADKAAAIVQAWYGGNEIGNAVADVIFGDVNPSGKLSLSFPKRNEDNPAFLNYTSDDNRVFYGEDVYIGYRFYEKTKKEVLFPFGHGLSYTTFDLSSIQVSSAPDSDDIVVSVNVANTGKVNGAEVVQVYVAPQSPSINRPKKELKGFTKVFLKAGESKKAEVKLSKKYATSFYHEGKDAWLSEKGQYKILVGNSSASTPLEADLEVAKSLVWKGL